MAKKASITASAKGGSNIPPLEPGTYAARCFALVHIGTLMKQYDKNKPAKPTDTVRISWEVTGEEVEVNGEMKPRVISKEYMLNLSEKSNLYKDLMGWRGKPFTPVELEAFEITDIIGTACMLSVVHQTPKAGGNPYGKVASVSKVVKGLTVPKLSADLKQTVFAYNLDDKEFLEIFSSLVEKVQDDIVSTPEWKARKLERPAIAAKDHEDESAPEDEVSGAEKSEGAEDDDAPF